MRYVSTIPPVSSSPINRQVTALSAIQAVSPVHTPVRIFPLRAPNSQNQSAVPYVEQQLHREMPTVDRRKYCRRVSHQAVLVELRSGIDRRHHNVLAGDVVEHIDETV
jgi:hypothetical protein